MSSKKKVNGYTTIRRVEEARKKCGCALDEFFTRATMAENAARRLRGAEPLLDESDTASFTKAIELAVRKFRSLRGQDNVVDPRYEIPKYIIAFAEKVVAGHSPRPFHADRKRGVRPSFAARA